MIAFTNSATLDIRQERMIGEAVLNLNPASYANSGLDDISTISNESAGTRQAENGIYTTHCTNNLVRELFSTGGIQGLKGGQIRNRSNDTRSSTRQRVINSVNDRSCGSQLSCRTIPDNPNGNGFATHGGNVEESQQLTFGQCGGRSWSATYVTHNCVIGNVSNSRTLHDTDIRDSIFEGGYMGRSHQTSNGIGSDRDSIPTTSLMSSSVTSGNSSSNDIPI